MPSRTAVTVEIAKFVALRYPKAPETDPEAQMVEELWLEDLAALDDRQFSAACARYRKSIDPDDRWFPTPGRILACSPYGEAVALIGSDADADAALGDYLRRYQVVLTRGGPSREHLHRHLDPDPYRNDAMFAAFETVGPLADPPTPGQRIAWRTRYMQARRPHAAIPEAVHAAIPGSTPRPALTVCR